jgi:type IV pilus assembly protein PilQ
MNKMSRLTYWAVSYAKGLLFLLLLCPIAMVVWAGEIQSLSWDPDGDTPALQIRIEGDASYNLDTLEGGERLRISFADSTMGPALNELSGQNKVKGVYPYLAENGTAVNVDILLTEPGRVGLEKTAYGFRAVTTTGGATAKTVAEAPSATVANNREKNSIEEILYAKLPGDRVQITIKMSKPPSEPNAFSITNPARVSFDFSGTGVALQSKTVQVKEGAVANVRAIEAEDRTRVVLSLTRSVAYTTSIAGNNFVVTLEAPTSAIAGTEQPKTTRFASGLKTGKYNLKDIDFRRGPQGDGKIIITLSEPAVGIDIREQAGEIVLDFLNTSVTQELQRRLDVVDFATPVQTIDTYLQGKNTRMVISPKGKYEHVAYQAGNVFTVSVKPIIEKEGEKRVDEFGYSGEKLSLNFQNIDVRAALQVLADFTGLNFVVSDTVRGSLTLRLKDVPWDQALDIIIDAKNLAIRRKGNVITVAPAPEVAAKEKADLEAAKAVVELEPLVSELIQINYAKASDIASLLKSIKAVTTGAGQHPVFGAAATGTGVSASTESNSLLSPRGQVTVDARTNSLLIQDTAGKIREVRKLIAQLDQPVRQVLIETRLVEATDNFAKSLGVRFGVKHSSNQGGDGDSALSGNIEDTSSIVSLGTLGVNATGLNVNLASGGAGTSSSPGTIGFTIAKLGPAGALLNLELSALEQEGRGKIISSPRIITANQKKATIEQGQERVFTTSVLGVGSVVTKKATLKLDVTPQITPDDRVNLNVNITKDNFADAQQGLLNVKEIKTEVLLDNGETVVIGGIYEQDASSTVTKVPFFGDIPLLGWLFRSKT